MSRYYLLSEKKRRLMERLKKLSTVRPPCLGCGDNSSSAFQFRLSLQRVAEFQRWGTCELHVRIHSFQDRLENELVLRSVEGLWRIRTPIGSRVVLSTCLHSFSMWRLGGQHVSIGSLEMGWANSGPTTACTSESVFLICDQFGLFGAIGWPRYCVNSILQAPRPQSLWSLNVRQACRKGSCQFQSPVWPFGTLDWGCLQLISGCWFLLTEYQRLLQLILSKALSCTTPSPSLSLSLLSISSSSFVRVCFYCI